MKNKLERLKKFELPQIFNIKGGMYWCTSGGDCITTDTKGGCEMYWEGKLYYCDCTSINREDFGTIDDFARSRSIDVQEVLDSSKLISEREYYSMFA